MYNAAHNRILLPHQITFLKQFFAVPTTQTFFLTGGTALSAFYFGHRESRDFDLFSIEEFSMPQVEVLIGDIARDLGATVSVKVATNTYKEIYLTHLKEDWVQRIDIVREQPKHFGTIIPVDDVRVDSLENIGSNKILTLLSRLEPKDYVDFYMIITKSKWTFDQLFPLARQKDTGLSEFYFANSIASVENITSWPPMKISFDYDAMISFYQHLARELLLRIKPKE